MNVLALSDSLAPWHSFWIRFGQYAKALPWPVTISSTVEAIDSLGPGDRLLFYRYSPQWSDLAGRLYRARERGVIVLSDLDDYLWQARGWDRQRLLGCTRALRMCHGISCSTGPLLEQLRVMFPNVALLLLQNTAPQLTQPRSRDARESGPLRIGWTGAPWTRPEDLALLKPLAAWIAERPEQLRLVHVGHGEGRLSLAACLDLPEAMVEAHPLNGHRAYLKQLNFEIGLAPLARSSFNHYKSAIKTIEYSCLGIPWIASDAEPYRELCRQWQWPGRLCSNTGAWIEHLRALLDPALRKREGLALQHLCEQRASYASGVERWRQLLTARY